MKKTVPQIHFKRRRLNGTTGASTPSLAVTAPEPTSFTAEAPARPRPQRRRFEAKPAPKPRATPTNERTEALKEQLRTAFPAVFGMRLRPLKVGIHRDIWQRLPEVDHTVLDALLSKHTGQTDYLQALANGGQRYDLDGHVVEPISSFAQKQSSQRLANTIRRRKD